MATKSNVKPAQSRKRSLKIQSLEERQMMHADAVLSDAGELVIDAGVEAADVRVADLFGNVLVVSRNASGSTHTDVFDRDSIRSIVFKGSDRADTFINSTNISDVINGNGGNDLLTGGAGRSVIDGGAGNDIINGGAGNDWLRGRAGDDTIRGNHGHDSIDGGAGNDQLHGDELSDRIWGGQGKDFIHGGHGDDIIKGGYGDDVIFGDAGRDRVFGEYGNDTIWGDQLFDYMAAADFIDGGAGNDRIYGGGGADDIFGRAGDDQLYGANGDDLLDGGSGDDGLYGGNGSDTLKGRQGNDDLYGGGGVDILIGGKGKDTLDGGAMRDRIIDLTADDAVQTDVTAQLRIDNLFAEEASDGAWFSPANDVYIMVSGMQNGVEFGPIRIDPAGSRDVWELDTGDTFKNVVLWQDNLKPGESVDLFVTLFDQDDGFGQATLDFVMGLAGLAAGSAASFATGGATSFAAEGGSLAGSTGKAINDFYATATKPADDILGVFHVRVTNVGGKIQSVWSAAAGAMRNGTSADAAGDYANFKTWTSDGRFRLRTSVREV